MGLKTERKLKESEGELRERVRWVHKDDLKMVKTKEVREVTISLYGLEHTCENRRKCNICKSEEAV